MRAVEHRRLHAPKRDVDDFGQRLELFGARAVAAHELRAVAVELPLGGVIGICQVGHCALLVCDGGPVSFCAGSPPRALSHLETTTKKKAPTDMQLSSYVT